MEELEQLKEEKEKKYEKEQKKEVEQQKINKTIIAILKKFFLDLNNIDFFNLVLFNQLISDILRSFLDNLDV
jgi:hypothetical protein